MRDAPYLDFPLAEYERRVAAVRRLMAADGLDLLLLTGRENVEYLCGFTAVSCLRREQPARTTCRCSSTATGRPVEGYDRKHAVGVMRDGLRVPVRWTGHNTLAGVNVSQVRLRFHFYGRARLYSFTFQTA